MAFDSQTRNALARLTADARVLLVEEFTRQLQTIYGIQPTGQISDIESLAHLDDEQRAVAGILRDRIRHLAAGNRQDKKTVADAVDRLIREQSFTLLNRFAAMRMCEERGIVQQCVGADVRSKGFQVYLQTAGSGLGEQYDRYRTYLFCIFDEIAVDFGVLFDRYSSYGLLFPRETALFDLLGILNRKELSHVWVEDEAIGWIYQYYNDPTERKKMREESSAPRNSRELAVRNQFFTPRYVVEFLTDNTLGRIWYEMCRGETRLKEQCRYLVRRPTETFLAEGESPPNQEPRTNNQELSQSELLRQPVYIPHRPRKDPRTILMLDPACGSMHFGLYAFDLFEVIYDEAWAMEEKLGTGALARPPGMKSLHDTYTDKGAFLRDVPRLIIEHNIHGIDIDPRCTQIAGLSLWLRAQKAWQRLGLKPADRPTIKKSNIVCAEPMPGEKDLLQDFAKNLNPPVLGQIVARVWDAMQLAGEAGSLLKIEEQIADWVKEAKKQWLATPTPQHMVLFKESARYGAKPDQEELPLDLTGISDSTFWDQAEDRIYSAIQTYAQQVDEGGNTQRRLFAEDATRGFAFIDVCRKRYDVALMNPPFGEPARLSREYLVNVFPEHKSDVFAMFVVRYLSRLNDEGRLGAITNKTGFFLQTFEAWRQFITSFPHHLASAVDLGFGVLDNAMVETMSYVIQRQAQQERPLSLFCRLTHAAQKAVELSKCLEKLRCGQSCAVAWLRNAEDFTLIPYRPMCYWAGEQFLRLFAANALFAPKYGHIYQGIATGDNLRFLRCRWEVAFESIASGEWVTYAKGGESTPYYAEFPLVVLWSNNGQEIKENARQCYGSASRTVKNENAFLKAGLTYTQVTVKGFFPRVLPKGCVFDMKGPSVLMSDIDLYASLGILCSAPMKVLAKLLTDCRQWHPTNLMHLPFPELSAEDRIKISQATRCLTRSYQTLFRNDESSALFCEQRENAIETTEQQRAVLVINDLVSSSFGVALTDFQTLEEFLQPTDKEQEEDEAPAFAIDSMTASVHYIVGCVFGRWDIRYATGEQAAPELPDPFAPLPICPPGQLQNAQGLPARPADVPAEYPVLIPWDGILVDDPNHPLDIERRVRESIEIIWKDRAEAIEHETCEILGVKSLRDYFRKHAGFFADHLKRYSKSRRQAPIYWPLSTASGNYTLWIYYHRLNDQMLFKCVTDFLEPKIRDVSRDIERMQKDLVDGGTAGQRDDLDALMDFRLELEGMKTELLRVAHLPYKPNLNDGVIINAAPLGKLFRLNKWQKDCRECWGKLEAGDYDWAHMAFHMWPDRVREKCRTDKSLAIAHNLEDLYEEPPAKPRKLATKKRTAKKHSEEELDI
jgi:hypothetical protein